MSYNTLCVWGPKLWHIIHTFAATYTPEKRYAFETFIYSLCYLLPCPVCRNHFTKNLKKYPLCDYLFNDETVFLWSYLLHDEVNKMNTKSNGLRSPKYSIARDMYFSKANNVANYGPKLWHVLHTFAANVEYVYRYQFKTVVYTLTVLIPCSICRTHFTENLKNYPIDNYLSSSNSLFLWTYLMHNAVNERHNKLSPQYELSRQYFLSK